jgi:uroporphyrinogen-III synthase
MRRILYLGLDPSRYFEDAEIVHVPVIRCVKRPFEKEIKRCFERLNGYTHVLFTSRTALFIYKEYSLKAGFLKLDHLIYLCIGKSTAQGVQKMGLKPSYIAQEETGEGIIALLRGLALQNAHLFFPRSAQGRPLIVEYLEAMEISFTLCDLYDTLLNPVSIPDLALFDKIIFTSPSTVHAFFQLSKNMPPYEKCHSIGPVTQKTLDDYF